MPAATLLYGSRRSRAARPIWLAYENTTPIEIRPVLQAYRLADPMAADAPLNTASPAFRAMNPLGKIPFLVDGETRIGESIAICLHLAAAHPGPASVAPGREAAEALQWALWAATEVEPWAGLYAWHRAWYPPESRDAAQAALGESRLGAPIATLEAHLAGRPFLLGARFTVADVIVAEIFRTVDATPEPLAAAPRVRDWYARCQARPAFVRMWAERELEPA